MSAEQVRSDVRSRPGQADFLSLAETLSSLIALIQDGKLIYVNKAACALLGRSKEVAIGQPFYRFIHPEDQEAAIARGQARLAGIPQPKRLIERLIHADGRTLYIDYSIDLIQFEGKPTTLVTGYDVTERIRAEESLRKSEASLAEAQRVAQVGNWEWDMATNRVTWSNELYRILGLDPATVEPTYELYLSRLHPEDRLNAPAGCDNRPYECEQRMIRDDGEIRTVWTSGRVDVDASGKPVRMYGAVQDITERRRAEEAHRQSEQRFRNLFLQAPVMMMAFDPAGRVRDVSNFWLQTMGYDREEIVGREAWHLITPESQDRLRRAIAENERNRESVLRNLTLRAIRKDGTTLDLLCTSVAEVSDNGESKGSICVEINLTDLQRAEVALRESEERYRALVEHAPEAIMVLDVETDRFVDANAPAEKLFGVPREKLLTMGPLDFCPEHQADRRRSVEVVEDEHRKVLEGETPVFEFTYTASGRRIECQVRLSRLPAAGRKLIRVTVTDISELKQLQEKVRHAEKLAAVGVLAAGVAHEIGNPLMALSQAAQSLERRSCDDYAKMKLALIGEHIERISRIVRQMSNLARPQNGHRKSCDLNQIVRRSVDMVRYDKRSRNSEIRYELAEALPAVEVVEDELTQVCINLALNAFDAMAGNAPDRPRCLTIRSAVRGSTVRISFSDTGHGVSLENRSKLFQPFFTTKEAGHGTGLGLSVSYRILQEHQGNLRLEEDGSPGAVFVVELPVGGMP
jgi:two-component system, sporulation sensor kinase A